MPRPKHPSRTGAIPALVVLTTCLLASFTAAASANERDGPNLAAQMQDFVGRFVAAYESGDVDQLMALYAPHGMIWGHGRPTAAGHAGIREFFATSFDRYKAKVEAHVLHFEAHGERVMLQTLARIDLTPKAAGQEPQTVWFRDIIVLVRGPSGWLIETNVDQPTTQALYEADLARRPFR